MERQFYIYAYLDPTKNVKLSCNDFSLLYEPYYIGKGKGNRYLSHFKNYGAKGAVKKTKSLMNKNIKPIVIKLYENLIETDAFEIEKNLITKIGRRDIKTGPLLNMSFGGQGGKVGITVWNKGKKLSEQHKLNLKKSHLGQIPWNKGKQGCFSKETLLLKAKIQKGNSYRKGKKHTDETKEKIRQIMLGKTGLFYKHVDENIRVKVVELIKQNIMKTKIAKLLNIKRCTVYKILKEEGII